VDPKFNVGFEEQINRLIKISPYDEIMRMLHSIRPQTPLRPDGVLFLLVNVGRLIVIPWDIAIDNVPWGSPSMGQGFLGSHGTILYDDLREIIAQAEAEARSRQEVAISANILLSVTGARTVGLRTRTLNIWGP
jgi:hypothetical protein